MKNLFIAILILISAISCKKEETKGLDVSITGFVKLINESGIEELDFSGARVTNISLNKTSITDENGKYFLSGMKAVTWYDLEISKEGYASKTLRGIRLIGNQKPAVMYPVTLYQIPSIELIDLKLSFYGNLLLVNGIFNKPVREYKTQAFVNDSAGVSQNHYDIKSGTFYNYGSESLFNVSLFLNGAVYKPGTTVYLAVYLYNPYDYSLGTYKKSAELSIQMP